MDETDRDELDETLDKLLEVIPRRQLLGRVIGVRRALRGCDTYGGSEEAEMVAWLRQQLREAYTVVRGLEAIAPGVGPDTVPDAVEAAWKWLGQEPADGMPEGWMTFDPDRDRTYDPEAS